MHEVSLVAEMVEVVRQQADGAPVRRVRLRHATTIPEDVIRQSWALLTEGDPLANVELDAEPFEIRLACPCGFDGALDHDDIVGPSVAVCPSCGELGRTPPTAELELLEVDTGT